ncbi:MAG: GH3 auxin-responsive promoter family protein [Vicinamibacterales bacterium]
MLDMVLHAGMLANRIRYWRPLERLARRPAEAQQHVLLRLLAANRGTRFGVEHGFADIANHRQYLDRVPVQEYEALRPYIDEQRRTGARSLTAESPIFYAQTSGTTGTPKHVPITPSALDQHRGEQALFSYLQYRACPGAFAGKALGIMGAAVEGHLDSGHVVGSVSGHLYQSLPRVVRSRFVVPPEVSSIKDYDLRYLVILRLALAEPDITYMGSPNPSTFLRLLDILTADRELLVRSLETGTLDRLEELDRPLRDAIAARLAPNPARAAVVGGPAEPTFATLWPGIRLVTTWTGGSCGIALDTLRPKLPAAAAVMELGYQSTECRGTIALAAETPGGIPPLHHHFFEFVEQTAWDAGRREFLTLEGLQSDTRYYIVVSTAAGLYRYFMNDLVEVTAFFHRTPLLRFVQKGKGVTNLTGEKLYEAQVIQAVRDTASRCGWTSSFFLLVADEQASAYRLYIEPDGGTQPDADETAAAVDRRLGELNIEYQAKRESGRLGALGVAWLRPGTADAYKAMAVRKGQRESQFKPAVLQYRKDLVLPIDEFVAR